MKKITLDTAINLAKFFSFAEETETYAIRPTAMRLVEAESGKKLNALASNKEFMNAIIEAFDISHYVDDNPGDNAGTLYKSLYVDGNDDPEGRNFVDGYSEAFLELYYPLSGLTIIEAYNKLISKFSLFGEKETLAKWVCGELLWRIKKEEK